VIRLEAVIKMGWASAGTSRRDRWVLKHKNFMRELSRRRKAMVARLHGTGTATVTKRTTEAEGRALIQLRIATALESIDQSLRVLVSSPFVWCSFG
jgi:hypothetical protein